MPVDTQARILAHDALGADHFLLTLEAPRIARQARPGQFVMLQVDAGIDPLLRRPMSICRVPDASRRTIQVLYKIVGRGTARLATQRRGGHLRTLGPLGNGFTLPPAARRAPAPRRAGSVRRVPSPPPVMVAGGIGIAIFPFLAAALRRRGDRPVLLFGARTSDDLAFLPAFRALGVPVRCATEDGSRGTRGYVTRLLEPMLAAQGPKPRLYACGPTPMLAAVSSLAVTAGADCELALESQMPCGLGVCLGCVVPCPGDEEGPIFRRICVDGPVVKAGTVIL